MKGKFATQRMPQRRERKLFENVNHESSVTKLTTLKDYGGQFVIDRKEITMNLLMQVFLSLRLRDNREEGCGGEQETRRKAFKKKQRNCFFLFNFFVVSRQEKVLAMFSVKHFLMFRLPHE
jgi:hypothetical protein